MKGGAPSRRVRGRRWAWRLLICSGLGAATTVGVAWGIAGFAPQLMRFGPGAQTASFTHEGRLCALRLSATGREQFWLSQGMEAPFMVPSFGSEPLPLDVWWSEAARRRPDEGVKGVVLFGFGWPRTAMSFALRAEEQGRVVQGGIVIRDDPMDMFLVRIRVLPLHIVALGFAVNTSLYFGIWFLVLFGPHAARRMLRLRRGACPRCAYDLRRDYAHGCPECGWNRVERAAAHAPAPSAPEAAP